jgi:type I restriction enzyme S subunit
MTRPVVKLGDVADMLSGFAFKSQQFLDSSEDGVYLVRGDNVQQGFIRWGDKAKKWRRDSYEDLARYQLQKDDVILAMDRPIVGGGLKLAWVKDQDLPSLLVQRVTRIRGLETRARTNYLRYVLSGSSFVAHIDRITTGANIPHISGKDISSFELPLPDLNEQDRIVECIAAYDDLIEVNQRRIRLLEEVARLYYREWFVNFRFPKHELYASSSGIPQGWHHKTIGELTSFLNRGIAPKYDDDAKGLVINQKCIRGGFLNLKPVRKQSKEVKSDRLLQVGDVLINSTGAGTLGRVAIVRSPLPNCTVDTHVTIARPANASAVAYIGMALLELESTLSTMGVGSTNQLELSRADIATLPIFEPPLGLLKEFQDLVWPIIEQSEMLGRMNVILAEVKQELLPRVMSGEFDV